MVDSNSMFYMCNLGTSIKLHSSCVWRDSTRLEKLNEICFIHFIKNAEEISKIATTNFSMRETAVSVAGQELLVSAVRQNYSTLQYIAKRFYTIFLFR